MIIEFNYISEVIIFKDTCIHVLGMLPCKYDGVVVRLCSEAAPWQSVLMHYACCDIIRINGVLSL